MILSYDFEKEEADTSNNDNSSSIQKTPPDSLQSSIFKDMHTNNVFALDTKYGEHFSNKKVQNDKLFFEKYEKIKQGDKNMNEISQNANDSAFSAKEDNFINTDVLKMLNSSSNKKEISSMSSFNFSDILEDEVTRKKEENLEQIFKELKTGKKNLDTEKKLEYNSREIHNDTEKNYSQDNSISSDPLQNSKNFILKEQLFSQNPKIINDQNELVKRKESNMVFVSEKLDGNNSQIYYTPNSLKKDPAIKFEYYNSNVQNNDTQHKKDPKEQSKNISETFNNFYINNYNSNNIINTPINWINSNNYNPKNMNCLNNPKLTTFSNIFKPVHSSSMNRNDTENDINKFVNNEKQNYQSNLIQNSYNYNLINNNNENQNVNDIMEIPTNYNTFNKNPHLSNNSIHNSFNINPHLSNNVIHNTLNTSPHLSNSAIHNTFNTSPHLPKNAIHNTYDTSPHLSNTALPQNPMFTNKLMLENNQNYLNYGFSNNYKYSNTTDNYGNNFIYQNNIDNYGNNYNYKNTIEVENLSKQINNLKIDGNMKNQKSHKSKGVPFHKQSNQLIHPDDSDFNVNKEEDFKTNKKQHKPFKILNNISSNYEISDEELARQASLIAREQAGCRYIQKRIEDDATFAERVLYGAIFNNLLELMIDPFGNYLIQKMLENLSESNIESIIKLIRVHFLSLGYNSHGTRVIQKVIDCLCNESNLRLFLEAFHPVMLDLMKDVNGNHIIIKFVNKVSFPFNQTFYNHVIENIVDIATHKHACCALQKCIDSATKDQLQEIVSKIIENLYILIIDPFGNYILQYIIMLNDFDTNYSMAKMFTKNISFFSKQKFSSNVIEKMFDHCNEDTKLLIVKEICIPKLIVELLLDGFGNYVLQKVLAAAKEPHFTILIQSIGPYLDKLRNLNFGMKLYTKLILDYPSFNIYINNSKELKDKNRNMKGKNEINVNFENYRDSVQNNPSVYPNFVMNVQNPLMNNYNIYQNFQRNNNPNQIPNMQNNFDLFKNNNVFKKM